MKGRTLKNCVKVQHNNRILGGGKGGRVDHLKPHKGSGSVRGEREGGSVELGGSHVYATGGLKRDCPLQSRALLDNAH